MLDIKWIRENKEKCAEMLLRKKASPDLDGLLEVDAERRVLQPKLDNLKFEQKNISKDIGRMLEESKNDPEILNQIEIKKEESRQKAIEINEIDIAIKRLDDDIEQRLLWIPNMPHESVPIGESKNDNIVIKYWG
jgi:seryl-tRNA synthetase